MRENDQNQWTPSRLLGTLPAFRDLSTWAAWLVFLKATYGEPLTPDETALFCTHTGRSRYAPPPGGWAESAVIVGRQSGKSRIAAAIESVEVMQAEAIGQRDLYAQDHRGAQRTLLNYAREPFELASLLRNRVVSSTNDTVTLRSGNGLAAYPGRHTWRESLCRRR